MSTQYAQMLNELVIDEHEQIQFNDNPMIEPNSSLYKEVQGPQRSYTPRTITRPIEPEQEVIASQSPVTNLT